MITLVACGGSGSRMLPVTKLINKHLIPVGQGELMVDMPLIFLAKHDIKDIHVVTGSNHASQICEYISDGERYGFRMVEYSFQPKPLGIADVLKRVSHRESDQGVLMILGDNFFSHEQSDIRILSSRGDTFAHAWEYDLGSPSAARAFGQVVRDCSGGPISIVEKPKNPQHGRILTGLYYFPSDVFEMVEALTPSQRGELEVTDLLRTYLERKRLKINDVLGQWADLGEQESWAAFVSSRKTAVEELSDPDDWQHA